MGTRAAVYLRISDDKRGDESGVTRQSQDCRRLAEQRGFTVERVFTDNDLSAYSGKRRPEYMAMLDAVAGGEIDVILAWAPDRLHRSPVELEEFVDLVERYGVQVETVRAGRWDLSSAPGRFAARSLGNAARFESEMKSERILSAMEDNAARGRPHGRTAYGWRRVHDVDTGRSRDVVDEAQAAVVRGIATDIVAGKSLRHIASELNESGVASPSGRPWAPNLVRAVVVRERNVARRVHRGQDAGEAAWDPILDRGLYEQVCAVLTDPARRTSSGSAAKHLLSGIATCGPCGGPVRGTSNRGIASYKCADRSCVSRRRADVDDLVTRILIGRLAMPDAVSLLAPEQGEERGRALTDVATVRARLDAAADDYANGTIDRVQLARITARLRPQLADAEGRARRVDDNNLVALLAARPDAATAWGELALSQRRTLVGSLLDVRVLRTRPGAREFDPESIAVSWKESTS